MSDLTPNPSSPSPGPDTEREDLPSQLWQLWRRGHQPEVRSFLAKAGPLRPALVAAVLLVDQRERWQAGDPVLVEAYLREFPLLEDNPDAVLDLVYAEFLLREQRGESPLLADFQRRFPHLADRLRQQLEFHQAVSAQSLGELAEPTRVYPLGAGAQSDSWPSIPGYTIMSPLGRGGMGVVYLARQVSLNRLVALKMIRAQDAHAENLDRFQIEAQAVARLQHPNIVQIYEISAHDGRPYMALEYLDGGSLDKRLSGVPQPPRQAAQFIETLARAMHAAHLRGIIHRDLKPGNVLLQSAECRVQSELTDQELAFGKKQADISGKSAICNLQSAIPKITDFGLAKLLTGSDSNPTRTGDIMGTPSYMAPEQTDGRSIGPAADVYALGAILYELLTGRPPFKAATAVETVMQVRAEDPVPPSQLQSRTPRDLETICLKCLEKMPGKRYASAADLAEDLRRFQAGEVIQARPARIWERAWQWARRRPVLASLLAMLAIVLGLGLPLVTWLWQRAERTAQSEAVAKKDALEKAEAEKAARKDLQAQLYFNRLVLAQAQLGAGNIGRAEELLDGVLPELRQWEWRFLKRLRYGPPLSIPWRDEHLKLRRINNAAYGPTGRFIAMASWDGELRIWDTTAGAERVGFVAPSPRVKTVYSELAFSPDGEQLAAAGLFPAKVAVLEARTGKRLFSLRGHRQGVTRVTYRPTGGQIATASADKTVVLWDSKTGTRIRILSGHDEAVYGLAYSADGNLLASASFDATVKIWDLASGKEVWTLRGSKTGLKTGLLCVAFSPDGQRVAAGGVEGIVTGWDVSSGKEVFSAHQDFGGILSLAFSPDNRRLAGAGFGKTVQLWDVKTGQEVLALRGHTDFVSSVAFSGDGHRLLSASWDGTVKVWDARPLEDNPWPQLRTLTDSDTLFGVAYCADGQRLASAGVDGVIKIWDPATGQQMRALRGRFGGIHTLAVSPDGKRLATVAADNILRLWDVNSGEESLHFAIPGAAEVMFRPDGKRLATPSGESVKIWDVATGEEVPFGLVAHKNGCYGAAFAPDGRHLASVGFDQRVRVWDLDKRRQVLTPLEGHEHIVARVTYSKDGRRLASGGWDGVVKIWDAATGADLHTLRHGDHVMAVTFTPNGKRLVSAGTDGILKIWNVATGKEEMVLRGHVGGVWSLSISPDGRRLAACGGYRGKGEIKIWDLEGVEKKLAAGR